MVTDNGAKVMPKILNGWSNETRINFSNFYLVASGKYYIKLDDLGHDAIQNNCMVSVDALTPRSQYIVQMSSIATLSLNSILIHIKENLRR